MPCEHNQDALSEAAASEAPLSNELRARLAECGPCREAFAREQALLAAIDSGLYTVANADVPPSLLPRVRAAIETVPITSSRWGLGWFSLAGASLVAATLLLIVFVRPNRVTPAAIDSAANHTVTPETAPPVLSPLTPAVPHRIDATPRPPIRAARAFASSVQDSGAPPLPEVLLPHDDEIVLAGYIQQWSSRKRAPLVASRADDAAVALLDVVPIQIAGLDVKPLAEGNSQ